MVTNSIKQGNQKRNPDAKKKPKREQDDDEKGKGGKLKKK